MEIEFINKLKFFGLKSTYTEQELNDAYNYLIKFYVNNDMIYTIKEIYNELLHKLKTKEKKVCEENGKEKKQNKKLTLEEYKRSVIKRIEKMVYYDYSKYNSNEFRVLHDISSLKSHYSVEIIYSFSKMEADSNYISFIKEYKSILFSYYKKYFNEHFIDESEVDDCIDLEVPIMEFLDKLVAIKNKYSKESTFKSPIYNALDGFKKYENYSVLEKAIEKIGNEALKIEKSNYSNLNIILMKMVSDILTLFDNYKNDMYLIEYYKNEFKKLYGEDIIDLINTKDEVVHNNLRRLRGISTDEIKYILAFNNYKINYSDYYYKNDEGNICAIRNELNEVGKIIADVKRKRANGKIYVKWTREELKYFYLYIKEDYNYLVSIKDGLVEVTFANIDKLEEDKFIEIEDLINNKLIFDGSVCEKSLFTRLKYILYTTKNREYGMVYDGSKIIFQDITRLRKEFYSEETESFKDKNYFKSELILQFRNELVKSIQRSGYIDLWKSLYKEDFIKIIYDIDKTLSDISLDNSSIKKRLLKF